MVLTSRIVASPTLVIESEEAGHVVVFDSATGKRARLTHGAAALLRNCHRSIDVAELAGDRQPAGVLGLVERLMDLGFLVPEGAARTAPTRSRMTVSPTLFRAPMWSAGQKPPDIAFLGVPYDSGNAVGAGARLGPAAIRAASVESEYRVELATGRPIGWLDLNTMERVLEGVTIADWGDLAFTYGEPPETIFSRHSEVVAAMIAAGSFPLCVGGDHSISYGAVNAVQRDAPVVVIWLDAHTDCAFLTAGASHHHGNVLRRILGLSNVVSAVNVGLRGYTTSHREQLATAGLSIVSAQAVRGGVDRLLRLIPRGTRCYLSIDIDVLDPSFAPGTSSPVPGGLTSAELRDVVSALAEHCQIVAADLVEVNPQRDPSGVTAAQAYSLVTAVLGLVFAHRRAELCSARAGG